MLGLSFVYGALAGTLVDLSLGAERAQGGEVLATSTAMRLGISAMPNPKLPFAIGGQLSFAPGPPEPNSLIVSVWGMSQPELLPDQAPFTRRVLTLDAVASLRAPAASRGAFSGGPVLHVGVGLSLGQRGALVYAPEASPQATLVDLEPELLVPLSVGGGLEVRRGERLGLRLSWDLHAYAADSYQYEPGVPSNGWRIYGDRSTVLDLLVRL